ncbi:MAG: glycerol kinase GlpK [Anaerolineae bacterium]|jgi:glycerol kinase|nr:glycerol kinase GlpK [Anaerolineae bacterium]
MSGNILAIDQGTTNTKALVVSLAGTILARGSQPTTISYPQPGWVEQDALEVWHCTRAAITECLSALDKPNLMAIAITNQRETALVWERETGQPVGPCVVWQCRRSAPFCSQIKMQGLAPLLREHTGLQVDPMFSASKFRWILEHTQDGFRRAEQGELCVGNIDAWVLWNLTGGAVHATDLTNASRTQLLNLHTLAWDDAALNIFGIPTIALPEIKPSSALYGETVPLDILPGGIPITAMIGDSHAALYGQAGFKPGSIKATYGTGSSLMTPISQPVISENGLSTTIAWAREKATYALEGNIYATGAAVQWLGKLLNLADPGPDVEKLARSVVDAGGVVFVPAFVGLGAPHWKESARGLITGLTRGAGAGQLARATLESIAYQVRDVYDVMQVESGTPLQMLLADGGASRNDLLMQFQADVINCPVLRSTSTEISPLGAAFLAGLTVGLWSGEVEIEGLVPPRDRFEPQMSAEQRGALYANWREAVARTTFTHYN